MRRLLALALAALLFPLVVVEASSDPIRIAVIDTGIDATHKEFHAGQILAWRDFTAEASPTPKDGHGHGTATASLAAGNNVAHCGATGDLRKISFAPGADLIVARVGTDDGAITGNIESAIDWARLQGADVITMSIGVVIPFPSGNSPAIDRARAAGILMVVSAGNGINNFGLAPYPTWMSAYGNNREALVVGAADRTGQAITSTTGNSDPDVTSWGERNCVAQANTNGYTLMSGTSFAAPLVAGMAGGLAKIARANGQPTDADRLETLLLMGAANNIVTPYHREGLGHLVGLEYEKLTVHAAAGTTPDYTRQGTHAQVDLEYHLLSRALVRV